MMLLCKCFKNYRYLLLLSIVFVMVGCDCPDYEFREYVANVHIKNNVPLPVSLNIRVEYKTKTEVAYRYAVAELNASSENITAINTGAYGGWNDGHSDCAPPTKQVLQDNPHPAEFSVDSISQYTICSKISPIAYEIYEFGSACPFDMNQITEGWS